MSGKIKKSSEQSFIERVFESSLWSSRYIIICGVVFSVLSSITLFLIGSFEIINAILYHTPLSYENSHKILLVKIIGAVDFYLIGVVLMIFGFGIYELFISKIDIARDNEEGIILEIESLDELKEKIMKVIIMVLIVSFFEKVLKMDYQTPVEMMYFALSILALSLGVYLVRKKT